MKAVKGSRSIRFHCSPRDKHRCMVVRQLLRWERTVAQLFAERVTETTTTLFSPLSSWTFKPFGTVVAEEYANEYSRELRFVFSRCLTRWINTNLDLLSTDGQAHLLPQRFVSNLWIFFQTVFFPTRAVSANRYSKDCLTYGTQAGKSICVLLLTCSLTTFVLFLAQPRVSAWRH